MSLIGSIQSSLTGPASGAYTQIEHLLKLRTIAKGLILSARKQAKSEVSGLHKTRFRGRGVDFEEVRIYQAGDDIRSIDWRVTARSGKPHTKLYREERERPVIIACDQSQSMFFGSRHCFKSVLAANIASIIAWAALDRGDRVGGAVFGAQHHDLKPKRSHHNVLALLRYIHQANNALSQDGSKNHDNFSEYLHEINRIVKPGSAVFIISDFLAMDEAGLKQLYQLSRHNELCCIHVYDPLERELPPPGRYFLFNGQQQLALDSHQTTRREAYIAQFDNQQDYLKQQLGQLGIAYCSIATDESPLMSLKHFYGQR